MNCRYELLTLSMSSNSTSSIGNCHHAEIIQEAGDIINTLPAGNNLGWIRPQRRIIESRVTACRVFFSMMLYVAQACNLLVSSVKTNVSLPINHWCFL